MRARLPAIAFRLLVLTLVWLLGTSTLTFAGETVTVPPPSAGTEPAEPASPEPAVLVVPDVRGLPYVFAKGILEDAGFAWKVQGKIQGFAVNLVDEQSVGPGTRVVDTGAPTINLKLRASSDYPERGVPESASPYPGTELVLATARAATDPTGADAAGPADPAAGEEAGGGPAGTGEANGDTEPETTDATATGGAETTGTAGADAADGTAADLEASDPADAEAASYTETPKKPDRPGPEKRVPAFIVPGAPREPRSEIPLTERAKRLGQRMRREQALTPELADFFGYQHAWVVTGARFGWWHGAEALRILIRVDQQVQERFGIGYKSEAIARAALAEVVAKSRS